MKSNRIVPLIIVVLLVVSVGLSLAFGWEFLKVVAASIIIFVIVVALLWGGVAPKIVFPLAALLVWGIVIGINLDSAPKKYEPVDPKSCFYLWDLVEEETPPLDGKVISCKITDFEEWLQESVRDVNGENYLAGLQNALDDDHHEKSKTEQNGGVVTAVYPRFTDKWRDYQIALANEATNRLTWESKDMEEFLGQIFILALVALSVSFLADLIGLKIIGGGEMALSVLVIAVMLVFRKNYFHNFSEKTISSLVFYWQIGWALGAWNIFVGVVIKLAKEIVGKTSGMIKTQATAIGLSTTVVGLVFLVPNVLVGILNMIDPTFVAINMAPTIVQEIIMDESLSMSLIIKFINFGFLTGVGTKALVMGLIDVVFGKKTNIFPDYNIRVGGLFGVGGRFD